MPIFDEIIILLHLFLFLYPILFLSWIIPAIKDPFERFWSMFIGRALVAPIYLLFIYFSLQIISGLQVSVGGNGNGRHFDDLVPNGTASTTWPYRPNYTSDATQGSANNTQNLKLDGTGTSVAVPLWVVPNSTSCYIKVADTLAGGAGVKITAVSSLGVLTYATGTIDPNVGTDYQRLGTTAYSPIGAKCFPSVILSPVLNGRADINVSFVHTGTGWVYEFKRLLKTADVLKQDVNFSGLEDQPFGVAVFDKSNYQHAIKTNLVLKFKK